MSTISIHWPLSAFGRSEAMPEPRFLVAETSQKARNFLEGTSGAPEGIKEVSEGFSDLRGGTLFVLNWFYCPEVLETAIKNGFTIYNIDTSSEPENLFPPAVRTWSNYRVWVAKGEYLEK